MQQFSIGASAALGALDAQHVNLADYAVTGGKLVIFAQHRACRGQHFGKLRVDIIEEADELLMPVALHVATDDGAVENVEGGKQGGCAVAFVIVGHRPGAAGLHRQSRLGAVEGLDLALLVDRENDGVEG